MWSSSVHAVPAAEASAFCLQHTTNYKKGKTPALTDFSGMLPSEYHWRDFVSRPSSAWDGVVPKCCGHGGVLICHEREHTTRSEGEVSSQKAVLFDGMMAGLRSRPRLMSTSQLNTLLCLDFWPLDPVVYRESYPMKGGTSHLKAGFPLRCFQRLSVPDVATLHVPLV